MRIGELAERTDVSTDTLRFYEKRGLIRSERRDNGYRDFDADAVRIVELVRLGQRLGFNLREIKDVTAALSANTMNAEDTSRLLRQKLMETEERVSELKKLQSLLTEALEQACPLKTRQT
ncbi:MerR family transcriptional regulator [uncultured Nitratireductor sp.]|uniref:MerR family transcriptional regulator n=1 Tax=uncultured Nitratireductor sp. TaxID=520953 RepID=UPI0025F07A07|nr:MerR family transcriptional regulator [uncultured Nitratireductor sp.]